MFKPLACVIAHAYTICMNRLTRSDRIAILHALVEGNSLRATSRLFDVSINTVTKLLVDAGKVASAYQDETLVNLRCRRIQADEIWAFVGAKDRTVTRAAAQGREMLGKGSIWTWTAICQDSKLVLSFLVGARDLPAAKEFMRDVEMRLAHKVQLSTDGHFGYLDAVPAAFGDDIHYGQVIKQYGAPKDEDKRMPDRRYSPADVTSIKKEKVIGRPKEEDICTSHVERQNLTMRMSMRRFTRLTNGFSKKAENHAHAVALHFWYYNFARIHKTIKMTPAMKAGVTDRLFDLGDLVDMIAAEEDDARDVGARRKDRRG